MRKFILNLHLYCALIAGIFIVTLGVTGSIIAFEDDIDRLTHPALFHVEPQGTLLPVAGILKAAQAAYPGQRITTVKLPQNATDSASFGVKGPRQAFLNPYTGALLGDRNPVNLLSRIHQLHLRLLMTYSVSSGRIGANIVTAATAGLLFLVVSGIYLWWPVKRATIRWSADAWPLHYDLHNTAGIYSAAFLVVLAITGIVVHFDDDLEQFLHRQAGTQRIGRNFPSTPQSGVAPISPDESLRIARAAMPGAKPIFITIPATPKASYTLAVRYPEDLTPGGRSWLMIDQFSGKVLSFQDSRTVAMGTRAVKVWNRAVHTGDIYGYPTKILVSLSSLMLVVQTITGYYMWWRKLRSRKSRAQTVQIEA